MNSNLCSFINHLKVIRKAWGLSVSDLAEILGINKRVLYAWEAFEYLPTADNLFCWARALGLDIKLEIRK